MKTLSPVSSVENPLKIFSLWSLHKLSTPGPKQPHNYSSLKPIERAPWHFVILLFGLECPGFFLHQKVSESLNFCELFYLKNLLFNCITRFHQASEISSVLLLHQELTQDYDLMRLSFGLSWSQIQVLTDLSCLQAMNGQYLCNRQITVSYAYKKDTKGERHGTPAGKAFSHHQASTFL